MARTLFIIETADDTTAARLNEILRGSGVEPIGGTASYTLDDVRSDPEHAQHYRPPSVCSGCGWPFTDWQGELYCDECAEAIGDEDDEDDEDETEGYGGDD
jgi:hypothetical protein